MSDPADNLKQENGSFSHPQTSSVPVGPILPHLQQQQQLHDQPKIDYEQEAKKLEDKAGRFLAKQAHPVIIPSFAAWFKFSDIHEIEKRSLPDFFNESSRFKTSKAYKDVRNFMINTYRLSPYEYLTITAVRRNVAMDVASIVNIHQFLEKWGLINYQIDPRSKPSLLGPSFTGHFQVVLDTPQGLKPFVPPEVVENEVEDTTQSQASISCTSNEQDNISGIKQAKVKFKQPKSFPVNLSLRKNIFDSIHDFNSLRSQQQQSRQIHKTYICFTCGNDTVGIRYHNLRSRDTNLCSRCFQEGHFSANFHASDFVRLDNNLQNGKIWSDQELLLLLEGIEMYEDNWDSIVEHVGGSKSLEECVEKFLSLPIEDKYINEIVPQGIKTNEQLDKDFQTKDAIDATIKALLDGVNDKILKETIPESSKQIASKYLQESQSVIQDLVSLTLEKLDLKFQQLDVLETATKLEHDKYVRENEKLINDRLSLNKQILQTNNELSKLNVSKKLVLLSEQATFGVALVEKEAKRSDELKKRVEHELESVFATEPRLYKPWSL